MAKPQGFLTDSDKSYLRGKTEYTGENAKSQENQKRYRLRNRIQQTILDFGVLQHLSDQDRELVADEFAEDVQLQRGVVSMIAFAHQLSEDAGFDFRDILTRGITEAVKRTIVPRGGETVIRHGAENLDYDIEYTPWVDIKEIRERFLDGEELTMEELDSLLSERLADEEVLAELRKRFLDGERLTMKALGFLLSRYSDDEEVLAELQGHRDHGYESYTDTPSLLFDRRE